jgi:hypothetical protein
MEAERHRTHVQALREQMTTLDEELARVGTIIAELEERLATLEAIPKDQRTPSALNELALLLQVIPEHFALRAHLRNEQGTLHGLATEHERAARGLERETGS